MKNLVASPEAADMLKRMRANYDEQLSQWMAQAVSYNDYERYSILFDRSINWQEKSYKRIK